MNRRRHLLALGVLLGLIGAARAQALPAASGPWAGQTPLSPAELGTERGGFVTADGVSFSFGAVVQTYVDGQLALATNLNVVGPGDVTRTVTSTAGLGALTNTANGALLTLASNGGLTTLLQQVTSSGVQNVVSTSASNQTLSQNTQVTLTLAGFQQNQAAYALQNTFQNLSNQLNYTMAAGHP